MNLSTRLSLISFFSEPNELLRSESSATGVSSWSMKRRVGGSSFCFSQEVQTHQPTSMVTATQSEPMQPRVAELESWKHMRQNAMRNDIILDNNNNPQLLRIWNIRSAHTPTLGERREGYIILRVFPGPIGDDYGLQERPAFACIGKKEKVRQKKTHRFVSSFSTFRSILSHQEQTQDDTSNIGYHRQITRYLGGRSIWICVDINTLYGQKRDVGIQHHRCLGYGLDLTIG